jgi:pilus assembly protein CpaB
MRGRTLILFLVAVILAGGTAMLVRSWLAQQHAPPEATAAPMPVPQKSILVTRGQIPRGHILKPEDLSWQPWPEGHISPAYIQSEGRNFSGWVARAPFGPDEPITEAKIVSPGSRGFLAAALQPGMRAVSVVVNKASDVSGFILPGDQVDILITHSIVPAGIEGEAHQIAEKLTKNSTARVTSRLWRRP